MAQPGPSDHNVVVRLQQFRDRSGISTWFSSLPLADRINVMSLNRRRYADFWQVTQDSFGVRRENVKAGTNRRKTGTVNEQLSLVDFVKAVKP